MQPDEPSLWRSLVQIPKKVKCAYVLWVGLVIMLVLVYSEGVFTELRGVDYFFPFGPYSHLKHLGISELLVYALVPLVGYLAWLLLGHAVRQISGRAIAVARSVPRKAWNVFYVAVAIAVLAAIEFQVLAVAIKKVRARRQEALRAQYEANCAAALRQGSLFLQLMGRQPPPDKYMLQPPSRGPTSRLSDDIHQLNWDMGGPTANSDVDFARSLAFATGYSGYPLRPDLALDLCKAAAARGHPHAQRILKQCGIVWE